jgi:hypothetical protein
MNTSRRSRTTRTLVVGVVAALLAVVPTGPAAGATARAGPRDLAATQAATGCQVVAVGRAGRAWLPWAAVAVPGGRSDTVRVVGGAAARLERQGALVVVQRTSRHDIARRVPVTLEVDVLDAAGEGLRTCRVDVGRVPVDHDHHVRRVVRAH